MTDRPADIYAFIADGEDSFVAILVEDTNTFLPAVFTRSTSIDAMRPYIVSAAKAAGRVARLYHYKLCEGPPLEIIDGRQL